MFCTFVYHICVRLEFCYFKHILIMKDRIKKIMDNEDLTASKFADQLEINRAVVSHILNGRNNPSLDVVMKILSEMDYINSDWLLSGEGSMYKEGYTPTKQKERDLFTQKTINREEDTDEINYVKENSFKDTEKAYNSTEKQAIPTISSNTRKVKEIIIYYTDNTFETFTPH